MESAGPPSPAPALESTDQGMAASAKTGILEKKRGSCGKIETALETVSGINKTHRYH
jgi:hypothetical protein